MKITYDGNGFTGGTVPVDTASYFAGEYAPVKAPGTMIKDGSMFAGWKNLSNTKIYQPRNRMMVHRPTTLQAQWEPACVINYDTQNAINIEGIPPFDAHRYNIDDNVTIPPHDDLTALQAVVGEGDGKHIEGIVSLQGWRIITGADAEREVLKAGDTFTVTGGLVVLQAVWAAKEISIAYEINGAEGDTPEIQIALSARPAVLAVPTCTKAGYYFGGWRDMATDEVYEAGKEATFIGCTALEAVWTPLTGYTVHYDANGASGGTPPADERIYHGDNAYLPDPSEPGGIYKTGYTFAGWVLREPEFLIFEPLDAFPITQNTTFYARWMPITESLRRHVTYTSAEIDVSLDSDPPTDHTDYVDGDFAFAKTWSPFKAGRHVVGWKLGDTVYQFGDQVPIEDGSITLTAVWEDVPPVTIKFTGGEGTLGYVDDIICYCSEDIIMPAASNYYRTGYLADGWIAPDGTKIASGAQIKVKLRTAEEKTINYIVNWVDKQPEHTITYFSIGHDSGHVPVDPCKYHAGEGIPLAPAGDLRREGYDLAGWDDVVTGKTYSIPTNDEIDAYCNDPDRPDYDSIIPMMQCIGDHTLRAHWVPVAQLFFGSMGATSGLPPDPIRVRYNEGVRIPDGYDLEKTGYTLAGWKDEATGIIYKVGDWYIGTGSRKLILQPVFVTANIVEYIIPAELSIVNAVWAPKGGYCINCHSKQVIVPPEMKGNYCWVRSDTGERITETCEIHDIYGDICLTLTPISMSNDGDDRWVWSTHVIAEGLTPMHGGGQRCGDYLEFPRNLGAGFAGWILNNDERRIYQPGEKVRIYGHAQIRAVYPNATHTVTFAYPEGTLAEAPADTEALAEGALYQLPSGEGIRGPNGTKLLYWCGVDQTEPYEDERDIIRKWYPGEYLRVPEATEAVEGKMFNSVGKLVVYPMFGDKFTAAFYGHSVNIVPDGRVVANGVYGEYQAIRMPQVTDGSRAERTDDEWRAAWRIPAHSTDESRYTGKFGTVPPNQIPPDKSNSFIVDLIPIAIFGWVFYKLAKKAKINLDDEVACILEELTGAQLLTDLEYIYGDDVELITAPPVLRGLWYNTTSLPDANKYFRKQGHEAIGWRYVGGEGIMPMPPFRPQYEVHIMKDSSETIVFGARNTCKWEIIWARNVLLKYSLNGAIKGMEDIMPGISARYKAVINPHWLYTDYGSPSEYSEGYRTHAGESFPLTPTEKIDFDYKNPYASYLRPDRAKNVILFDRWYPCEYIQGRKQHNEHQYNPALPHSVFDIYLDARIRDPRNTIVPTLHVPDPTDPAYAKYFLRKDMKWGAKTEEFYVMTLELRWAHPEVVVYTYYRENRAGEPSKKGNMKISSLPKDYKSARNAWAPGEWPRIVIEENLPEFRRTIVGEDGDTYYFKHWIIRTNSAMYRYYAEHNIPERDKQYYANDLLPYVRVDQPLEDLYLDAVYDNQKPPEPEHDPLELGFGDEDTSFLARLFTKSPSTSKNTLKTINAYSAYQQNAANAQHKAQTSGTLDAIIEGAHALSAVASAIGSIANAAAYLGNDASEIRINDQSKIEEIKLASINQDTRQEVITSAEELNKQVKQDSAKMRPIQTSQWRDYYRAPPTTITEIEKLARLPELDTISDGLHPVEAQKIENVSAQTSKLEDLKNKIDGYNSDVETDIEDIGGNYISELPIASATTSNNEKIASDLIIYERGIKNISKPVIEKTSFWNGLWGHIMNIEPIDLSKTPDLTLIGTPSPHQLQENTAEGDYVRIVYSPRDPNDPNWYTLNDTVPEEDGKVPVLVHYLKFGNKYDDNAPDSETHTVDETYYEPHETVTVKECEADAPDGMEFAGWILDENETTRSIVQPGDTLVQDTCNHTFKALWLPEDPTRFPGLRNPAPIVPHPEEFANIRPFPDFGEEASQ